MLLLLPKGVDQICHLGLAFRKGEEGVSSFNELLLLRKGVDKICHLGLAFWKGEECVRVF